MTRAQFARLAALHAELAALYREAAERDAVEAAARLCLRGLARVDVARVAYADRRVYRLTPAGVVEAARKRMRALAVGEDVGDQRCAMPEAAE